MKITVVTINYNNLEGLKKTVESVSNQTYSNIEYIVIDGGSNDGSVEFLNENSSKIDYLVSEPDNGIYNAMNKGIVQATGEWINFMNSGDRFVDAHVIAELVNRKAFEQHDLVYGESFIEYPDGTRDRKGTKAIKDIWKGGLARHNAMFVRTNLMKRNPFSEKKSMTVTADFDFMYKMYSRSKIFYRYPEAVLIYESHGLSDRRSRLRKILDNFRIHSRYTPILKRKWGYYWNQVKNYYLKHYILPVTSQVKKYLNP